jgi:hypothetical protein
VDVRRVVSKCSFLVRIFDYICVNQRHINEFAGPVHVSPGLLTGGPKIKLILGVEKDGKEIRKITQGAVRKTGPAI